MHPIAQVAAIAIVLFLVLVPRGKLGGSFYWYIFSRHQWSLLELFVTLIVGTIPLAIVSQSNEISQDIIKETAGLILLGGLVLSFTGSAFGLMAARHFEIQLAWKRFCCLLLGWLGIVIVLLLIVLINKPDYLFG